MLKFSSDKLEKELRNCLKYISEKETGYHYLETDFYDILAEDFNPDDYEDIVIDEDFVINLSLDYAIESFDLTLKRFITMINDTRNARLVDNVKCISDNIGLATLF